MQRDLIFKLGLAIKLLRITQSISAKDLAEQVGITTNYISLIENGHKLPSLRILINISTILHVKLSGIFKKAEELEQ